MYHGEWSPSESPAAKTLGVCGPSGFGLGSSLGTQFTNLPPRLYQIMSHYVVNQPLDTTFLQLVGWDSNLCNFSMSLARYHLYSCTHLYSSAYPFSCPPFHTYTPVHTQPPVILFKTVLIYTPILLVIPLPL